MRVPRISAMNLIEDLFFREIFYFKNFYNELLQFWYFGSLSVESVNRILKLIKRDSIKSNALIHKFEVIYDVRDWVVNKRASRMRKLVLE